MSGSTVDCPPAAFAADRLDKAGVPNVLWGWWSFSLTNVHHFHIDAIWSQYSILRLHKKSRILWWPPNIPLGPVADDDFRLSTDPSLPVGTENGGIGTGPWRNLYPVKTLRAARLYESVILLLCIHWDALDMSWDLLHFMLGAGVVKDVEDHVYAEIRDNLKPEFKPVWNSYHGPKTGPLEENWHFRFYGFAKSCWRASCSRVRTGRPCLHLSPVPIRDFLKMSRRRYELTSFEMLFLRARIQQLSRLGSLSLSSSLCPCLGRMSYFRVCPSPRWLSRKLACT
ncbi:hypothetical protein BDW74DRAFT_149032 [Aspergillus multicolor]|uniref:uncharacterized protein n=1 Tax=Aspergillus multicolor TaxID=41759 RepID=UPI003CCE11E6